MLGLVLAALSVVEGYVVAVATGEPIPKARLTLRGGGRSYGGTSGQDGRFAIGGIEPGRYRLTAERNGYIPQSYGTRLPGRPGAEIALGEGEALRDVALKLTAWAAITGRITDEEGEPFARVQVHALQMHWSDGASRLIPVEIVRSDDRGEYRLFGLAPGRYCIAAEPQSIRGPGEPPRHVRVFFPGGYDVRDASFLEVTGGNELRGVDFQIGLAQTVRIRGRVLGQQGRPVPGAVVFAQRADSPHEVLDRTLNDVVRDSSGAFEIPGVLPGPYILTARGGGQGVGRVRVDAGAGGAEGATILLGPQIRVKGRVRAPDGAVLSTVTVSLVPRGGGAPRVARPDSSGAFAVAGLEPDLYGINAMGLPEGTWLSGLRLGTTGLPAAELDLSQDPGELLEVVLSEGAASVEGLVVDESDKPVVGAEVALLPAPERFRERRLMRFATADQHGRYSLSGVPPGEYTLISWDGLDPDLLQDHDFLRDQLERGKRVSVAVRDKKTVQLKAVAQ